MREIKVARVEISPGTNSMAWSSDGELAIAGVANVTIFIPMIGTHVSLHRTATVPVEQWPSSDFAGEQASIYGSGAQKFVSEVAWSPSGMTETRGCFFAALSSTGDAYLFANIQDPAEAKWELKASTLQFKTGAVHSIAWSRPEGDGWGRCKLALGTDSGRVRFLAAESGIVSYDSHIKVPDMGTITAMTWSENGLAVADEHNRVVILKGLQENNLETTQVLPASRFRIGALHWAGDKLIVAQNNKVTVAGGSSGTEHTPGFYTAAGIAGVKDSWAVFGSHGEVFTQGSGIAGVGGKIDAVTNFYGAALHPNHRIAAVLYTASNEIGLRYPLPSSERARIRFFPLQATESAIYRSKRGSLIGDWWAMEQLGIKPQGIFVPPKVSGSDLATVIQDLCFLESIDIARYRIRSGDTDVLNNLRRVYAETVLNVFSTTQSRANLLDIDRAVLMSLAQFCGEEFKNLDFGSSTVEIPGDFFVETFDFSAAEDPYSIESTGGRRWRRCSVTLLPILTQNTLDSSGGDYTKLDPSYFPQDSIVARVLTLYIEICFYTGARWYYRQKS